MFFVLKRIEGVNIVRHVANGDQNSHVLLGNIRNFPNSPENSDTPRAYPNIASAILFLPGDKVVFFWRWPKHSF